MYMIEKSIKNSIETKQKVLKNKGLLKVIQDVANEMVSLFEHDGKVLFCGNGGSAADAQHLAAELSGRFYYDRPPLFAEALHVNTSYVTAVANDYSYDEIFARLVKAKGRKGDMLFALSTSGNSKNILKAIRVAKDQGMITVGLTGEAGGAMKDVCNYLINVPSNDTPRIQEAHILLGHIVCEIVESKLFPQS
ncbi:MAG: phosphoheptose isomerase [Bacteroidetes bacterium 4572_114]|nr:MAG: phosphoheptose isomerase [Bacteroidetes bacterium 4572_114]